MLKVFDKLAKNTKSFANFEIAEKELKFSLSESRLQEEIRFLKQQGIDNVIQSALSRKETMAVHCLAGIGRTSTMLMASHIMLGENADELEQILKKQNPTFSLVGSQGEFLRSLSSKK